MTPRNWSSRPTGSWTDHRVGGELVAIIDDRRSKSAPTRSILLMNAIRGTR
jgi:hypothetical protein